MSALDERILRWELRLLRFGMTDRADYIVHVLGLLRAKKARAASYRAATTNNDTKEA